MNIKDLAVVTKTAKVQYPGIEGFEVTIAAISREVSKKLREDSESTKMDPKLRVPVKELDEKLFIEKFAAAAIKSWSGLKVGHLSELMLVELGDIDPEEVITYNAENAVDLLKNSQGFDAWINDMVFDITTFRNQ